MRAGSIPESQVNPLPTSILNDAPLLLALTSNQTNAVIMILKNQTRAVILILTKQTNAVILSEATKGSEVEGPAVVLAFAVALAFLSVIPSGNLLLPLHLHLPFFLSFPRGICCYTSISNQTKAVILSEA